MLFYIFIETTLLLLIMSLIIWFFVKKNSNDVREETETSLVSPRDPAEERRESFIRERALYIAKKEFPDAEHISIRNEEQYLQFKQYVTTDIVFKDGRSRTHIVYMDEIYGTYTYIPHVKKEEDEKTPEQIKNEKIEYFILSNIGNLQVKLKKCIKKGFNSFVYEVRGLEDKTLLEEIAQRLGEQLGALIEVKKDKKKDGEFIFRITVPSYDEELPEFDPA